MKGGGTSVAPIYAGVRTDVEKLLEKFLEKGTIRYGYFATCFKAMNFSLIYSGRATENELREFEEKILSIVLSYCFPPYSYQTQVGALYLLYALYYLQPRKYRMKIRATLPVLKCLSELFDTLKTGEHTDACYVLNKLFRDDAFLICAYVEEHSPLTYRRFDSRDDLEKATQTLRSGKSTMDELREDVLIGQLDTVHNQYVLMKSDLFHGNDLPQQLAIISGTSVTKYVHNAVHDCENKLERRFGRVKRRCDSTGESSPPKKRNVKETRSEIRQRAYATMSEEGRFKRRRNPKQVEREKE